MLASLVSPRKQCHTITYGLHSFLAQKVLTKFEWGQPQLHFSGVSLMECCRVDQHVAREHDRRPSSNLSRRCLPIPSSISGMRAPSEADLGMFSMFGRTGAPTKKGPHKRTGKFLQRSNMPEIIEIIIRKRFCVARWRHKVSSQVLQLVIDTQPCLLTCTTVSQRHSVTVRVVSLV